MSAPLTSDQMDTPFDEIRPLKLSSGLEAEVCDDDCLVVIRESRPDANGEKYELYLDHAEAKALIDWLCDATGYVPEVL